MVWRATREGTEGDWAVKVVKATKADKEPYQRFIAEIGFLRSLEDPRGVLPLVNAYLPEQPSSQDRPWLVMPIATPIADALAGAELETVVEAILTIARTLERLKRESGAAHRDIKPGNLYERSGEWLVGDFGLVAPPDKDELAKTGRPIGPAHYTAYELIIDPTRADPHPATVYSLAKTLWVLATGQSYPPEGHQAAQQQGFNIADWRPHPRAGALDHLIERCTRLPPGRRPPMSEAVSAEVLRQQFVDEAQTFELGELQHRLRTSLSAETAAYDRKAELREEWQDALRLHQRLIKPLNDGLLEAYPRVEVNAMDDKLTNNTRRTRRS